MNMAYYFPLLLSSLWMSITTPEQIRAQLCAYNAPAGKLVLAQRYSQLAGILLKPQFKMESNTKELLKL